MDPSSHYNPSYPQWNDPYSPHHPSAPLLPPPPPLPPPPHHQSHPESPSFYGRSTQNVAQHQDYHRYPHRQDLPPKPAVNQPSPYYSQHPPPPPLAQQHHLPYIPQQVTYESQRVSQPPSSSMSIPCTESRDVSQSAWAGFKEKRLDSWTVDAHQGRPVSDQGRMDTTRSRVDQGQGRNYQYDFSRSSRDSSVVSANRGLDGSYRSRDEFPNLGYERKEPVRTRIDGNYQDRGQLKSEPDGYVRGVDDGYRGLSSSVGYGSDRYGVKVSRNMVRSSTSREGVRNPRWGEAHNGGSTLYPRKKEGYYHSEIEQYSDRGRREESSESNRTPRKQMQKKSALLRLETPRYHQNGRENDWPRHQSHYGGKRFNSNSFRGKEHLDHSDRGPVERQRGRIPVDVSFKSNVMVGKAVASPTSASIQQVSSTTPRSIKARRALVLATEGNGKLRLDFSDEALVSEGSRQSTRQTTASEIEKKPDNCSTPSSSDGGGKLNKVRFVDGVAHDTKITNTGHSEAKVLSTTLHTAEEISSFCEALNEAKDDSNVKLNCDLEKVIDGDSSILKSHEDILDRATTGCNTGKALVPKVMEKEETLQLKTRVNATPTVIPVSWPAAADLSGCSEARIQFDGKAMCSVSSQPSEGEDMELIPSKILPVMEINAGVEERNLIGSSIGSLGCGEKEYEKPSLEASIYFNSEGSSEKVLENSDNGGIKHNKGINKNVDSWSPENDFSRGSPKCLGSPNVSVELDDANMTVAGDFANANSLSVGTPVNSSAEMADNLVKAPDMSVGFQLESKLPYCENTANSSAENVRRKDSTEPMPFNSSAEFADNLVSDEGKPTFVNNKSLSLTKVVVEGSTYGLPVERIDVCSRSDESDLVMAEPSDTCIENVSTEILLPEEALGLASNHPAESPSSNQFSDSDSKGLKCCFPDANVSLSKDITDGSSEFLAERDASQNASTLCDNFPSSSAPVVEPNLACVINGMSDNEQVTGAESGLHETQPRLTVCKFLPEDRFGYGSSVGIPSTDRDLEEDPARVSSCFVSDTYVSPCHISPLVSVNEEHNKTSTQAYYSDSQGVIMHKENICAENVEVDTGDEKRKSSGETSQYRTTGDDISAAGSLSSSPRQSFRQIRSEIRITSVVDETGKVEESRLTQQGSSMAQYRCLGKTSSGTGVISYDHPTSKYHGGDLIAKPKDDSVEKLTDVTSDGGSREKYSPSIAKTDIFVGERLSSDDGKSPGTEFFGSSGLNLSHADDKDALTHVKDHVVSVPQRNSKSQTSLSSRYEIERRKKKPNYSVQKSYPPSLPFVSKTKKEANPPSHITKRHTWHRTSDIPASPYVATKPLSSTLSTQQKLPTVTAQSSSSYVRKGNSLLRQPSPSNSSPGVALGLPQSAVQLNHIKDKSVESASIVGRQSKPLSESSTSKVSNAIATSSGKCALSYSIDHLTSGLPESIMDSATSGEANVPHSHGDTSKISDTQVQTGYASDCQQNINPPEQDSSNLKRMVYVKRKANQLVAASDIHGASKSQIHPSDSYFKRSKNQLVRNSESRVSQSPDDALDSRAAATMVSERSSNSASFDSAVTRPYKQSKFSLVWTLNNPQSRKPVGHMCYQRFLPQFVPWKRVTYRKRLMNSVSALRNGSFSNISQKLSMMRKRHTVYKRSSNGFSLRKSKVLSIGGSHLKWSKSIERDSRKANEEATLAVAAISKKESEKQSEQRNIGTASRNHPSRERIFRFGSLRYKMDASRRTLQRISDVDSPCSGLPENGKGAKRPFIPKRLVIGNEEYVRVGNGNQLVRDPKKRTRVLANEKVRWSLHNVRLRLAKKKKYCQFFTRFGKCNKDDGKCPYVHDPSKIAVCTKFLNGLCADANCKLTHKVIPERMPDCSYFLQGLCNNEACPYRHVHVNPGAAICDGFLKGYCSDGDECRKKHSYICPVFEATGSCSQGSKCKLHHPKNQSKGRKRKRASEPSEKNARGRYFGSLHKDLSESEPMVLDRSSNDSEVFGMEGLDFIFLGAGENDERSDPASIEQSVSSDDEAAPVSVYNLIRPVALMQ